MGQKDVQWRISPRQAITLFTTISAISMSTKWVLILVVTVVSASEVSPCSRHVYLARAEQADTMGRKCWDNVKVPSCGGQCDSREVSDWLFPFKKSYHPVCVFGTRRTLMVKLRHCDPDVSEGTERFHYIAADDCRCMICSSQHTSCEWLPPHSTILNDWVDATNETPLIDAGSSQ